MSPPPGTRIGACGLIGTLGAGGMGEIPRARDSRLKRDLVIHATGYDVPLAIGPDNERLLMMLPLVVNFLDELRQPFR